MCVCVFWGCCRSRLPRSSADHRSSAAKHPQPPLVHPGAGIAPTQGCREPLVCVGPAAHGAAAKVGSSGEARGVRRGWRCAQHRPFVYRTGDNACQGPAAKRRCRGSHASAVTAEEAKRCRCRPWFWLSLWLSVLGSCIPPGRGPGPPFPGSSRSPGPGSGSCGRSEAVEGFRMNHTRTHQTTSPSPETLSPARSALISVGEETSGFASKRRQRWERSRVRRPQPPLGFFSGFSICHTNPINRGICRARLI